MSDRGEDSALEVQIGLRDLARENWVWKSWFRDEGHIGRRHRAKYTRAFIRKVPEVFE